MKVGVDHFEKLLGWLESSVIKEQFLKTDLQKYQNSKKELEGRIRDVENQLKLLDADVELADKEDKANLLGGIFNRNRDLAQLKTELVILDGKYREKFEKKDFHGRNRLQALENMERELLELRDWVSGFKNRAQVFSVTTLQSDQGTLDYCIVPRRFHKSKRELDSELNYLDAEGEFYDSMKNLSVGSIFKFSSSKTFSIVNCRPGTAADFKPLYDLWVQSQRDERKFIYEPTVRPKIAPRAERGYPRDHGAQEHSDGVCGHCGGEFFGIHQPNCIIFN